MQLNSSADSCWKVLQAVKEQNPLIQCITNFVSMLEQALLWYDYSLSMQLHQLLHHVLYNLLHYHDFGRRPAVTVSPKSWVAKDIVLQAHSYDEIEEFQQIATGLVVNVGTLTSDWVSSMQLAAKTANSLGKPWVLDPVGAGATAFRTKTIVSLLKLRPTLIRGNASEIMAVAGAAGATTRGVDSTAATSQALASGQQLAKDFGCIVGISGAEDLGEMSSVQITDGERVVKVSNGNALMSKITAGGCSVTAMACAFITAAPKEPLLATAFALAVFGMSAQFGLEAGAKGPGSLRSEMLDALYNMTAEQITNSLRLVDCA